MKVAVTAWLLCLGALAAAAAASSPPADEEGGGGGSPSVQDERDERIFAFYTTTSITRLATTTLTALSTCLSVLTTTACQGRKKKSLFSNLDVLEDLAQMSADLVGSQLEAEELEADSSVRQRVVEGRDGRKLTIWSTNFTTLTVTSTSYLAGTTVTASALCTVPGLANTCFGK